MGKIFKLQEIQDKTQMSLQEIQEVVQRYVIKQQDVYEVDYEHILYDTESHVIKQPVWYVDVIPVSRKKMWSESYDTLAISDIEKDIKYVMNDHGIVVEMY